MGRPLFLADGDGPAYWVRGNRFVFKAGGGRTDEGFAVVETVLFPGAGAPTHIHRQTDEALYVLEGHLTVEAGLERADAAPGWFGLLPRGVPHRYIPHDPGPVRVLWFLQPAGFERMWIETGRPIVDGEPEARPSPPDLEMMRTVGARYATEFFEGSPAEVAQALGS